MMAFLAKPKTLHWTYHARAKMNFYKLSEQRVRRVLHSPKRIEEGIAPKTVAVMQPSSIRWAAPVLHSRATAEDRKNKPAKGINFSSHSEPFGADDFSIEGLAKSTGKRQETWSQEIWVMVQDTKNERKVISAWRYPGKTKPKSEEMIQGIKAAYNEYMASHK